MIDEVIFTKEDGVRLPDHDAVVEVCAFRYKKDEEVNCEEMTEIIQLGDWESVVDNIVKVEGDTVTAQKSGTYEVNCGQMRSYGGDGDVFFTEDFIGFSFAVIGASRDEHICSGLACELDNIGHQEVFEDFVEPLREIAQSRFDEIDNPPQPASLGAAFKEAKLVRTEPCTMVRFITIWSYHGNCYEDYYSGGYECDPEIDLLGVLK